MAAIENYNLAENPVFRQKVDTIMRLVASQVKGEVATESTPSKIVAKRAVFADKILWDKDRSTEYMISKAIVSPGTLTDESLDSDIEYMITQFFNDLSGVNDSDFGEDFTRIRRMAVYSDASTLTVELLFDAGVFDVIPNNLEAYKTAIIGENDFASLSELQTLVNTVNAI